MNLGYRVFFLCMSLFFYSCAFVVYFFGLYDIPNLSWTYARQVFLSGVHMSTGSAYILCATILLVFLTEDTYKHEQKVEAASRTFSSLKFYDQPV